MYKHEKLRFLRIIFIAISLVVIFTVMPIVNSKPINANTNLVKDGDFEIDSFRNSVNWQKTSNYGFGKLNTTKCVFIFGSTISQKIFIQNSGNYKVTLLALNEASGSEIYIKDQNNNRLQGLTFDKTEYYKIYSFDCYISGNQIVELVISGGKIYDLYLDDISMIKKENSLTKEELYNETFFENLSYLENIAKSYLNGDDNQSLYPYGKCKWLVSSFIRSFNSNYKTSNWSITGGSIDLNFEKLVKENYSSIYNYFKQTTYFYADNSGQKIDLYHQFATFSALLYYSNTDETMPQIYFDLLAGWAGDLQTLMNDFIIKYPSLNSDNDSNAYDKFYEMIGDEKYSFGLMDLYADIDAMNIYNMTNKEKSFNEIYRDYYNKYKERRFQFFYENIGNKKYNSKENVYNYIYVYTYSHVDTEDAYFRWPLFIFTPTETLSQAVAAAFNDYLYKLRLES